MTRVFKFSLKAFIERVVIAINFPCQLQVSWKRGNQKLETKLSDLNVNVANYNEQLEMTSNLYFEDQRFKEKKCAFTVTLFSQKGNKVAGQVSIDISQYLNKKIENIREELRLEKCPDKHAKLHVRFQFLCIEEVDIDQLSRISYASNIECEEPKQQESQTIQPIENKPQNQDMESELEEIKQLLNKEMRKVQQKDAHIAQLEQEISTKQEQLLDTKAQLEQIKGKFYETIDKLQNQEEQITSIGDMKKCMENKIKQLENYGQQCQGQIAELNEQLKSKQLLISQSDQKLQSALGQMQIMKQRIAQYEEQSEQEQTRKSVGTSKDFELLQKKIQDLEKQLQREQKKQEQDYALYQIQLKNLQSQMLDKTELITKLQKQQSPIKDDGVTVNLQKQLEQYQQKEDQFNKVLTQYKDQIQKQMQNEKKLKQQHSQEIESLSDQVIKLKCQLGDIFNTAYDIGGNKLVDRLQQTIGLQ